MTQEAAPSPLTNQKGGKAPPRRRPQKENSIGGLLGPPRKKGEKVPGIGGIFLLVQGVPRFSRKPHYNAREKKNKINFDLHPTPIFKGFFKEIMSLRGQEGVYFKSGKRGHRGPLFFPFGVSRYFWRRKTRPKRMAGIIAL